MFCYLKKTILENLSITQVFIFDYSCNFDLFFWKYFYTLQIFQFFDFLYFKSYWFTYEDKYFQIVSITQKRLFPVFWFFIFWGCVMLKRYFFRILKYIRLRFYLFKDINKILCLSTILNINYIAKVFNSFNKSPVPYLCNF